LPLPVVLQMTSLRPEHVLNASLGTERVSEKMQQNAAERERIGELSCWSSDSFGGCSVFTLHVTKINR